MHRYNLLAIIIFLIILFQFNGCNCSNKTKMKQKDIKIVKQQSETKEKCKTKVIYYNIKCCSNLEMQSDFEYVIQKIKSNNVFSKEGIAILPYEGDGVFELACDNSKMKIENVLTDVDLFMIACKFFDINCH